MPLLQYAYYRSVAAIVLFCIYLGSLAAAHAEMNDPLDTRLSPGLIKNLFPAADSIGTVSGDPPIAPVIAAGNVIGYLFSTHETVRPGGFFGASFDIVIGLDTDGIIVGHRTLEEHEPMIADGIVSLSRIDSFLGRLHGADIRAMRQPVPRQIDGLSGATVSAKAMASAVANAAILVGYEKRIIDDDSGGLSVDRFDFMERAWPDLVADGSVRQLNLTYRDIRDEFARQLGPAAKPEINMGADDEVFLTIYGALATPPTIGANLAGQTAYRKMLQSANPRMQHIIIAVQGDRRAIPVEKWPEPSNTTIDIVQNDKSIRLLPSHYGRLSQLVIDEAPKTDAVARFSLPPRLDFDATQPWALQFSLNEMAQPDGPRRRVNFSLPYRIPAEHVDGSDYALEEAGFKTPRFVAFGLLRESTLSDWQLTWIGMGWQLGALGALLTAVSLAILFQSRISRTETGRIVVRYGVLLMTVVWLGWLAGGQLTIVTVINYARVLVLGLDWTTVLLDPLLLILSIYVAITLVLWGRGVFCGWLCPFGAVQEILNKIAVGLRVPQFRVPHAVQRRLWLAKYAIAAIILALAVYSLPHALTATEIEPFKTVMTAKFDRSWPYVFYAVALLTAGLFIERLFCRYICPLGALLALAGRLRILSPLVRRTECGAPCRLCERRCPIDAIEPNGRINMTECFYCLDCQVLYYDAQSCPPLAALRKHRDKNASPLAHDGGFAQIQPRSVDFRLGQPFHLEQI